MRIYFLRILKIKAEKSISIEKMMYCNKKLIIFLFYGCFLTKF